MRAPLLGLLALTAWAQAPKLPPSPLSAPQKALHLLNRLAYGPRPGEAERLATGGDAALATWLQDQLCPLPEPTLEARLRPYTTLGMSIPELQRAYPRAQVLAEQQGLSKDAAKAQLKALPAEQRPARIEEELVSGKLFRALHSERQLEQVLVDFWFNHFNVDWTKGACKWFVPAYERDAIRPFVFGRFRDLLGATAAHPAMLFYLDNWLSTREGFSPKGRRTAPEAEAQPLGLNENYARELMELHTLGVEGGYTQADVREVARCFTGWSLDQPRVAAAFRFRPRPHDPDPKRVLGQVIQAGGRGDGEAVLDLLARHPATARFIATKLCRRFVSDLPPPALVARVAQVFLKTDGDLRQVYLALFTSPEFWSTEAHLAKVKTPFEFVASALRGLGAEIEDPLPLLRQLERMGQLPYRCAPPTGWKDGSEAWVNTGALISRLQFSLALGRQPSRAVRWDREDLLRAGPGASLESTLDRMGDLLVHRPLSEASRAALLKEAQGEDPSKPEGSLRPLDRAKLVGLLLGSPEFQRR